MIAVAVWKQSERDRTNVWNDWLVVQVRFSQKDLFIFANLTRHTISSIFSPPSREPYYSQVILAWSKNVASHDVSFAKGLLHSLMGGLFSEGQGGSNNTRVPRSVDAQPQNIEEEL